MPIHDQGIAATAGTSARGGTRLDRHRPRRDPHVPRQAGVSRPAALSWFPFFVRAVQIYAAANLPQAAFLAPTPETFRQFLDQQEIFVFFVTVYVGAGLIANDRRANALQIYLSKPLTRAEYVFGKLAILMTFLLLVTWVPAIVLLIVQISFAGNFTFFRNNLFLFPAITVFSFVQVTMVSTAMLALSSLSNSSRYVGILYAAADLLHAGDLRRALRGDAQHVAVVDLVLGQPRAGRRRDLPAAAAVRHAVAGVAADDRRR